MVYVFCGDVDDEDMSVGAVVYAFCVYELPFI